MISNFLSYIEDKTKEYVIFDVGSRDGMQSIEFYNNFPNAKIFCFECNPNTIQLCKQNIEPYNDRITLIEGAVCDYDGTITFYPINQEKTITTWRDGNPGASSLFKSNGTYPIEYYVQDEIQTNCHRLDSVMKNNNIEKVDIIWMDLQGAELLAFKGLGNYIDTVKYIHTEVSHIPMYTGQVMFNELHEFMISNDFNVKNNLTMRGWQEDAIYQKKLHTTRASRTSTETSTTNIFDIVIPLGPSDLEIIDKQIEYTKKNIVGYRKIYIVSYDDSLQIEGCSVVSEKIFPFSIKTVEHYHGKQDKNGWYLQQLLKLYSGLVIHDILDKYLVIDCDTFFIKPTTFYENNKCLFNYGTEYWVPYFIHMNKLHEDLIKMDKTKSGICHHMMFETQYIKEIIEKVEIKHNAPFYDVFLKYAIIPNGSGASEYEIYFNYMLKFHSDKIKIRPLKWANVNNLSYLYSDYDYISYHYYIRNTI
jgi:FkbM family methyltransferase